MTDSLRLDVERIERGVPISALETFVKKSGIPLKYLYGIVIPARTLKHRKARRERLAWEEADRLGRVVRIFDFAVKVFGETQRATLWLSRGKERLKGRAPLELLKTDAGSRLIEEWLYQIDEGIFP